MASAPSASAPSASAPSAPLVVWCNAELGEAARAVLEPGVQGHTLLLAARAGSLAGPADAASLALADVAFGQPDPAALLRAPRLRWVHLNSAGYTPYDREDVKTALRARGAALTKSSLVYDEPCAQHLFALMLAQARQLPAAFANAREARAWPQLALRAGSRLLGGQSAVLVGFGSIARRLVQLLAPLRMNLTGIRRQVVGDEPVPTFAFGSSQAAAALSGADHVIDVLPGNAGTRHFFDETRFASLKPGVIFYNIGRGATVAQDALGAALAAGHVAAAYLDVTEPEPLAADHPLWTTPGCFITPHAAGGHADEGPALARHFLDNLDRFGRGLPLLDRVY